MKFLFLILIIIISSYIFIINSVDEHFFIQNQLLNEGIRDLREKNFDNQNLINTTYNEINKSIETGINDEKSINSYIKNTENERNNAKKDRESQIKSKKQNYQQKSKDEQKKLENENKANLSKQEKETKKAIEKSIKTSFDENKITSKQQQKILSKIAKATNIKKLTDALSDISVGPNTAELVKLVNYNSNTLQNLRENTEYNSNLLEKLNNTSKEADVKLSELEAIMNRNVVTDTKLVNDSISGISSNNKGIITNSKNIHKNTEILKNTNQLINKTINSLKNDIEITENKFQNLNRNLNRRHQYLDCKLRNISKRLDNTTDTSKIRDLKLLKFTKELAEKNENLSKARDCKNWKNSRCALDEIKHDNEIMNMKQDYLIDKVTNRIFLGPYYHDKKQQWRLGYYDFLKQKLISIKLT